MWWVKRPQRLNRHLQSRRCTTLRLSSVVGSLSMKLQSCHISGCTAMFCTLSGLGIYWNLCIALTLSAPCNAHVLDKLQFVSCSGGLLMLQGKDVADKKSSSTTVKRGRVSGSSQDDKSTAKVPNAASRSPAPKPQKASGQKKGKDSGQSQLASASATGVRLWPGSIPMHDWGTFCATVVACMAYTYMRLVQPVHR